MWQKIVRHLDKRMARARIRDIRRNIARYTAAVQETPSQYSEQLEYWREYLADIELAELGVKFPNGRET